jgi:hypothetical protein
MLQLAVSVLVVVLLSSIGLWYLLDYYRVTGAEQDLPLAPLAGVDQTPPTPRLQSKPRQEFLAFRARQEKLLSTYAWVDQDQGVVRIPVARAMELALARGLPAPQVPTDQADDSDETAAPSTPSDEAP